jgi:KDO2-lipid IV(A) lauroyltransferase
VGVKLSWQKKIRYAWLTALAYLIYGFFYIFPTEAASSLGGWLMERIGPLMKHDKTARANLVAAFPEKNQGEIEAVLRGMWNNLGRVIAEYPHLHGIWRNVEFPGVNYYAEAAKNGGPCIFFGGHIANWEVQPIGAKQSGLDLHIVYRKPNNPWVDGLLRHARGAASDSHIVKGSEGAREILSVLRKGGAVGMLVDQKLNEGIPVPFFGRDAMTVEAIAHFALKFGCPLYPTYIERLGGATFRLNTLPPLVISKTGDKEADVRAVMVEINRLLESWIRQRPEQWLWVHNRWPK